MAGQVTDSLLQQGEEYDPRMLAYELAKIPAEIERLVQVISARASDFASGTTVLLPVDTQIKMLLPYDRARVRALIKIPSNATAGTVVYVGGNSDVSGGQGYVLYPGDSLEVKSINAVFALVTGTPGNTVAISRWVEAEAE